MSHSTVAPSSRLVSVGHAAELLGVSRGTVRTMADCGELSCLKTIGGHRRIEIRSINRWLGFDDDEGEAERKTLIYARVSSRKQKVAGDLDRQAERLRIYCRDLGIAEENIQETLEVGSGLSETRKGYLRLLDLVIAGQIRRIVVTHSDRLARFGTSSLRALCEKFGVDIVVTNQKEDISDDEELSNDVLSIITHFSARKYGARGAESLRMPLTDELKSRIIQLHQQQTSQDKIAATIQAEGYRCEKTGKLFKINSVRQTLLEHEKLRRATSALAPNGTDTLQKFLSESCATSTASEARVFTRPLHAAYSEWCQQNQIDAPTSRMMTARRKKLGFKTGQTNYGFCFVKGLTLNGNPRASETHLA